MDECLQQNELIMDKHKNTDDHHGSITFTPPLYMQRYCKALQILAHLKPKKVADFGCAECKFMQLLKREHYVEEISGIDIDRALLEMSARKIEPLTTDYINPRTLPLTVKLLHGSVLTCTEVLKGYDAITCIELVEHLMLHQLPLLTKNIFGYIRPKVVVISTPNVEFNVLFSNSNKLRHWDHKFEWTRDEFESWCYNICTQYGYSVDFDGVGEDPLGNDQFGFCSQIAIFIRNKAPLKGIVTDTTDINCSYTTIASSKHPYKTVQERREDDIISNLRYYVSVIVLACRSALQSHNDNVREFHQKNAWNEINKGLETDWLARNAHNPLTRFFRMVHKSEEDQFLDSESEDTIAQNSTTVNTYGQETYSVVVSPWKGEVFLQKLLDKCLKISQSIPAYGQFDDAFELIPSKVGKSQSDLIMELSQYNNELSCCLKISDKSPSLNFSACRYIMLNFNDNILHIPLKLVLEFHQFKVLNCDSEALKDAVKQRCPEGIFLVGDASFLEVDIHFEETCDSYDTGYSDHSSDTDFEYVHPDPLNESFTEENWDLDSAYNDEKSSQDCDDQVHPS